MEQYNASRNTVRDAIKSAHAGAWSRPVPGQGTFVVETIIPFITTLTGDPTTNTSEGDTYLKEVGALRRSKVTPPRVRSSKQAVRPPPSCSSPRGFCRQPPSAAFHR